MMEDNHGLSAKEPVEISLWHYYNGTQAVELDELVSEFNSTVGEEKGIVVSAHSKGSIDDLVSEVNNTLEEKVGAAKDLPNMFASYLDTAILFDQKEKLVNLDNYVSKEEKESYVDNYIEEGCFGKEDNWMLFPVAKSTEILMINKTEWEPFSQATGAKAEDLSTWEGLAKTAESYYEYSGGKSFFGRDAFANYMIVGSKQLGEETFQVENAEVTLNFNEETAKKLWDNFYVPYIKGYYKHVGRYRSDDVKIGEIISLVCSSSSAVYFPKEVTNQEGTHPIDYMVLPVPNFEGTEKYAVQQGASIAVTKSTEQKEYASVVFLQWMTEKEQNMKFSIASGYLPVKKEANTQKSFEEYLKNCGHSLEGIEKDTIETALKQIEESNMYTTKGFDTGYSARAILNNSMPDLLVKDKETLDAEIAAGAEANVAVESYLTEEHFKEWYQSTKAELESCCK